MLNFIGLTSFLGNLFRLIGLGLFGFAAGWFSIKAYKDAEGSWPLQIAIYLGFLLFTAIILGVVSPGSGGSLTLGAAIALLYWGNKKDKNHQGDGEESEKE